MKRTHRNWLRRGFALLLTFALLLPLGPAVVMPSAAVTQAEIDALKKNANTLAAQKKDLQAQLKSIRADKSNAEEQKRLLEEQINVIQEEISNIQEQIQKYSELIQQKEIELQENEEKREAQYQLFCQRIRVMEEEGETSYWSILFSANGYSDLLDSFMMIEEFIEYDNGIMQSLLALQEQIESDKAELEQAKADQEAAKKEQESAKQELKSQQAEVDKLIEEISAKEDDLEAQEAELSQAAAAADAEIKRKEKELAAQISTVVSESGFMWPLASSYNTLSSLYGSRIHPVTGKPSNHTGIDIPAPKGTPIYAAKSGVVTTSVYGSGSSWSYGNYVVVSHSDGTSTLYAHMSSRAVKEGQTVKQGTVLGYVGTTGRSTGNHLHFEVRISGNRTDPVNYFKDKTLYASSGGTKVLLSH
jgi:murein DD-endopeptidase MepM/ murein hydrolase activator NlpD